MIVLTNRISRSARFLQRRRWLILMLVAPFLFFPSPDIALALVIVPGLWIIFWLAGEQPFARTPLNPALLVLCLMMLVSLGVTYDVGVSLPKIAGLILGIGVFDGFASYAKSPRGWWLCFLVFLLAGLGVAVIGLLGTQWAIKFDALVPFTYRFEPRIVGLPGAEKGISPNEVAGALLWVIPSWFAFWLIGLTQLKHQTPVPRRWLAPINLLIGEALLFVVLVFLLCQSRSAYLALAVATVLLVLWLVRHRSRLFAGILIAIGILLVTFAWRYETDPLLREALGSFSIGGASVSLDTFNGRAVVWSRARMGIEKYPLTGMGMNTFRYLVNTLEPDDPIYVGRDIAHAHNEYFQAALDLGIPGLLALVGIYAIAFWMLRQVWRQATWKSAGAPDSTWLTPRVTQVLVLGLGLGLFAHLLYGLTEAVALGAKPGILFWMLLGLVAGLYQQEEIGSRVLANKNHPRPELPG
ncbi:MAG: O-antigen ligase family protein [Chloroflexi bacterium]|nr:O-antigen ligase family protein [Chloroflexota bacterium]